MRRQLRTFVKSREQTGHGPIASRFDLRSMEPIANERHRNDAHHVLIPRSHVLDAKFSLLSDSIDFLLDGQRVKTGQGQTKQKADSAIQNHECITEGLLDLLGCSDYSRRVWHAPMRGHWLTRPDGANFFGRVIAHGENKMQIRCSGLGEFVPILATDGISRQLGNLELSQCLWMNTPGGVTSCAVSGESRKTLPVHDCFSHDGAGRISGTEEENVVASLHDVHLSPRRLRVH